MARKGDPHGAQSHLYSPALWRTGCIEMKAAILRCYGPPEVLTIEDVEKPAPKDGEVLVRVRASTVCTIDWRFRSGKPFFFIRPMLGLLRPNKINILGLEFEIGRAHV